jgi:hypothetical protein
MHRAAISYGGSRFTAGIRLVRRDESRIDQLE